MATKFMLAIWNVGLRLGVIEGIVGREDGKKQIKLIDLFLYTQYSILPILQLGSKAEISSIDVSIQESYVNKEK